MGHTSTPRTAADQDIKFAARKPSKSRASITLNLQNDVSIGVDWTPPGIPGKCLLTIESADYVTLATLIMTHQIAHEMWWALSNHSVETEGELGGDCA